jgi:hypothetical protein
MDARIKSGHDERVLAAPLSQDAESLETVIASEAKQSILPLCSKDGLLRCARNDV